MPSPRSSPSMRPASPLSPRYEPSRFETMLLQPPTPRSISSRGNTNSRRTANNSLRLPTLPRFHPANFPSAHSSYQTTPEDESIPRAPLSPRTHQKMFSEAQKQLLMYHRDSVAAARAVPSHAEKPLSPRLMPMGSPGLPVTPLELESEEEYLVAGIKNTTAQDLSRKELVDALIQKEVRQSSKKTSNGGSRTTRQ